MKFADKLKKLMKDLGISQSKVSQLTGYGKSSVSQWVSGKNEPSAEKKKEIALALGVPKNYFDEFEAGATLQNNPVFNLPIHVAARLMGKSKGFVQDGLKDERFPWGYAVKMSTKWSYWINSKRFSEIEGIDLPLNEIT
ncbi:XRE family transcriptional regulator [bacterium D16-54]|jgi:transcriptional regulator with XRE-family HTH domain|nr:XRE family transcriptional regulator [bacterium D16-54]RKJ10537.1 XRE family transcriptional regulator [bacterium D16-56]